MRKALLFIALFALSMNGVGISISPGTFLIQDVPLGVEYDITANQGYVIRLSNVSPSAVYILTPRRPSEDNTRATGYYDFPEPSWFHTGQDTLVISAHGYAQTQMWLTMPDDPSLYNRHFLLGVDVSPTIESSKGLLSVGAYLLYRFETLPKEGVKPILHPNEMAFVPSVVTFENVKVGDIRTKELFLYSGDSLRGQCRFYRLDPESDVAKLTILTSPGFRRAPENIVFFPEEGWLSSEGTKFFVQIAIPEEIKFTRIEEIIIAEAPNGNKSFLRVKLLKKE